MAAALRVIERDGVPAVTQRAVAAEADVPPSAVLYYFASVDELLVATLVDVNDRYVAAIAALPDDLDAALDGLADIIGTGSMLAEYELWLLAARRPELNAEFRCWWDALDELAARLAPGGRVAFAACVDGLCLRAGIGALDGETVREALAQAAGRDEGPVRSLHGPEVAVPADPVSAHHLGDQRVIEVNRGSRHGSSTRP